MDINGSKKVQGRLLKLDDRFSKMIAGQKKMKPQKFEEENPLKVK